MQAQSSNPVSDYLIIARRRWWMMLGPALVCAAIAYGVSLSIPNRYTSETVVLVDHQKVPDAFVRSVVTDDVSQRLGTMQEQILSRTRLQDLIERFSLYKKDRGKVANEDLIDRLRKQITVSPIRADYAARTAGLPGFSIAVTAEEPRIAQSICAEVTSMFIAENLKLRGAMAQGTTEFLKSQLDAAKKDLDGQDARLADFKRKYIGQLPGAEQGNINMIGSLTTQLDSANQALSRAQQDKIYLESMLAGHVAATVETRSTTTTSGTTQNALQQQLALLNQQLASLEGRYTKEHPEVVKLRQQIAEVRKQLDEAPSAPAVTVTTSTVPDVREPAEVRQMRAQLRQLDESIREHKKQQERIQTQLNIYQDRLRLSPTVEEEYKKLTRDYQSALGFYNDLLSKYSQSEMATNLERRQEGEQFRVMDPPNLPERPTFPNRGMFSGSGAAVGFLLGLVAVVWLETSNRTIQNISDVERYLDLPILIQLPEISFAEVSMSKEALGLNQKANVRQAGAARHV